MAFQVVALLVVTVLAAAFWEIQVIGYSQYAALADENRIGLLPIRASRGNILDRHGRIIVQSRIGQSVLVNPSDHHYESLARIAAGLNIDLKALLGQWRNASDYGWSSYVKLKEGLSVEEISFLQANRSEFPHVDLIKDSRRQYPASSVAVHAIGYVGDASRGDLNSREFLLHEFGTKIGKSGLERVYNHWLAGKDGSRRVLVDSMGRHLELLGEVEPTPGRKLTLTIDLDLQTVAEMGLEGRKGAVVALDPRNGEVLVMASAPEYDPNQFVVGHTREGWFELNSDTGTPMLNRAVQGTYAMGSVFKPFVGLAGLEAGIAGPDYKVHCPGGLQFGSRFYRCHKRGGHGTVSLVEAIALSCDVYFYRLGHKLGIDTLARYARMGGLGVRTGIDLPDEVPGLVPDELWKVRHTLQPWHPGETIIVAIGQGAMAVTPIQAAHAVGGLAMGGVWHQPRLIPRSQDGAHAQDAPPARVRSIDPDHLDTIRKSMWTVVNGAGTGGQARLRTIEVCGKTGTSQRVSNDLRLRAKREDFEDDAWFVGFAPCHDPEIVVAVLLENGKASYYAAAVARDIMATWQANRAPAVLQDSSGLQAQATGGSPSGPRGADGAG